MVKVVPVNKGFSTSSVLLCRALMITDVSKSAISNRALNELVQSLTMPVELILQPYSGSAALIIR